jgi:hypothetical protein
MRFERPDGDADNENVRHNQKELLEDNFRWCSGSGGTWMRRGPEQLGRA